MFCFILKIMAHQFGMKWNIVTTRNGRRISCNHATPFGNRKSQGIRKCSSIIYGCDWVIKFKFLDHKNALYWIPSRLFMFVDLILILVIQHFLISTLWPEQKQVNTKRCTDSILQKIMHQMSIDQEVNSRTMIILLKKVLPSRKYIDRHLINNVRIRKLKTKNDLEKYKYYN